MFLYVRMTLYFFFPLASAYGFGEWNEATGKFTMELDADQLAQFLAQNLGAYIVTYLSGRVAKARGGKT